MTKKAIVLVGPQGCGKGRISELLHKRFNYHVVNMGGICRSRSASDSTSDVLRQRTLLSDDYIEELLRKEVLSPNTDSTHGFVLDGVPRNEKQVRIVKEVMGEVGVTVRDTVFVYIVCDRSVCHARMRQRISEMTERGSEPRNDDNHKALDRGLDIYEGNLPSIRYEASCFGYSSLRARASNKCDSAVRIFNLIRNLTEDFDRRINPSYSRIPILV